jgi:hypothetical protein
MIRRFILTSLLFGAILALLAGCSSSAPAGQAPDAVNAYLTALVERNANQASLLVCKDWEPQARLEYDSFAAVKLSLNNLECKADGQDGAYTLVSCTGSITANYGAEDQQIDIAGRVFKVANEGGEWRVCGYHQGK